MTRKLLGCLLLVVALSPRVAGAPDSSAPTAGSVPDALLSVPTNYRLDTGDSITIQVLRHPEVTTPVPITIPPDGLVYPARQLAPVSARGKTASELAEALAAGWRHVFRLRPGAVTVTVTSQRVRRIYVRGNGVNGNGEFALKPGMRLSHLVAVVNGVRSTEKRVEVMITNPRRPETTQMNLHEATVVPGGPKDVPLVEGDTVTFTIPPTIRLFVSGEGPRGAHEVDHRYGLRRALTQVGYSIVGATGSLREAKLLRKAREGDPTSEDEIIPVDLRQLMMGDGRDVPLQDMDMLYIPPTTRQVYVFGEIAAMGIKQMREDRKTHLADVLAVSGPTGQARIGDIHILRMVGEKRTTLKADFGRYLKNQDPKNDDRNNPELLPQDIIFVPNVKRFDVGQIWTGWGLVNLFKTVVMGGL